MHKIFNRIMRKSPSRPRRAATHSTDADSSQQPTVLVSQPQPADPVSKLQPADPVSQPQPADPVSQPQPTTFPDPYSVLSQDTAVPASAPLAIRDKATNWAGTGWSGFKAALRILEGASAALPPLQGAVSGIVRIIEHIESINDAKEDFNVISAKIQAFVNILESYRQEPLSQASERISDRLANITLAMNVEKSFSEAKNARGLLKRIFEATDDTDDVLRVFRRITSLVEAFMMDTTLHPNILAEEIRKDTKYLTMISQLWHVPAASFDAQDHEECMEGTRTVVLRDILAWAIDSDTRRVYWLNGMAGTGKTSIALSVCSLLRYLGILGASFFCSRRGSVEQRDVCRIFPTLAYGMARHDKLFASALLSVLNNNPDVAKFTLPKQFSSLLAGPVSSFRKTSDMNILVIDALDKCENADATGILLDEILKKISLVPVKVFVTSWPESRIRSTFFKQHSGLRSILNLHDIEKEIVSADIELYLKMKLGEIPQS